MWYSPSAVAGDWGVHPTLRGVETWYKAWWFDGSTVWWGGAYQRSTDAGLAAEQMARTTLSI